MPSTFAQIYEAVAAKLARATGEPAPAIAETFTCRTPLQEREVHELCRRLERVYPDYVIEANQQIEVIAHKRRGDEKR